MKRELVLLCAGEPVYLNVIMGGQMPPVSLTVESPFQPQ